MPQGATTEGLNILKSARARCVAVVPSLDPDR
jgi:hypothetical protein